MINKSVYGNKNEWSIVGTSFPQADDNNFYLANFGDTEYPETLYGGVQTGRIALNAPLDKTLSWCGLGTESQYSHLQYWNRKPADGEEPEKFMMINEDNRLITNFGIFSASLTGSSIWPSAQVSTWYYADATAQLYGSRARWSPRAGDGNSTTTRNFNYGLRAFSQFPLRNCVLVPVLRIRASVTSSASAEFDQHDVFLWNYLDENYTYNFNSHPYIINIRFQCWGYVSEVGVGTRSNRLNVDPFVAVLDEVAAGKDQPYDVEVPSITQTESYQYYAFGRNFGSGGTVQPGISIMGMISSNSDTAAIPRTNSAIRKSAGNIIIPHPTGQWSYIVNPASGTTNPDYELYYVRYYDGLQAWIREQIACFGLFFTDNEQTALTGELDDDNMFLGILVDGVGHGKYSHGQENKDQPQWGWSNTNQSTYDPSNPPVIDPNKYDGSMNTHDLLVVDTATQRYALQPTALIGLLDKLWDIMELADPDQSLSDFAIGEFLASNPIDAIVSLQYMPVSEISTGNDTTVVLGTHDTKINCQTAKLTRKVDCGNYEIFPRFGNSWIDRQTKITLYLPFCGTINLDPEVYMGRTINVEYLIDLSNGTCTAIVSFVGDGGLKVITDTASGCCAMDLPVTGLQQQTLNSQLFNASESVKQLKVNNAFKGFNSVLNGAMSLGSQNPMATISGILGAGQDLYNIFQSEKIADYNLQHTMIPTKMIGTSGGLTGAMLEYYPTIIFERPSLPEGFDALGRSDQYAHSEGYACCISGSLSEFTGYTEILNVDLAGFDATITEKNMIRSVLAGGVYL